MRSTLNPKKVIVPLVILAVIGVSILMLSWFKPAPKKQRAPSGPHISVETIHIERKSLQPNILSYGLVEPRTKSKIVAQVNGRIELVSERFRDGGFFKQGDLLLKIEASDYEIEVEVAKANLAEAERRLAEEQAQSNQAREDWLRLGQSNKPSALVLREPQLKAAESNVESVKALLKRAQLNLARTEIRAPFDGRVLNTNIDLGQVASNNAVLGEIYATDAVEIRLPIKNSEIPLLNLPETYLNQEQTNSTLPHVNILSDLAGPEVWQGKIIRTASSIDDSSRQLYVVARIDDPFGEKAEGRFPLKIGQYVTAKIEGTTLSAIISIPNRAIYQGSYVYTYENGAVYRRPIDIKWQNGEIAIINQGLSDGDQLVISPLGQIASGTEVRLTNEAIADRRADQNRTKGNNDEPLSDWLANIPPERLQRLKDRAAREGKSLESIAEELRTRRENKREN